MDVVARHPIVTRVVGRKPPRQETVKEGECVLPVAKENFSWHFKHCAVDVEYHALAPHGRVHTEPEESAIKDRAAPSQGRLLLGEERFASCQRGLYLCKCAP